MFSSRLFCVGRPQKFVLAGQIGITKKHLPEVHARAGFLPAKVREEAASAAGRNADARLRTRKARERGEQGGRHEEGDREQQRWGRGREGERGGGGKGGRGKGKREGREEEGGVE